MLKIPPLAELQALRDGKPETLQDLSWLFQDEEIEYQVVLVDWVSRPITNEIFIRQ